MAKKRPKSPPDPPSETFHLGVLLGEGADLGQIEAALAYFGLPTGPSKIDSLMVVKLLQQAVVNGDCAAIRLWLISRQNEHWSGRSRRPKLNPAEERPAEPVAAPSPAPLLAGLRLVTAG